MFETVGNKGSAFRLDSSALDLRGPTTSLSPPSPTGLDPDDPSILPESRTWTPGGRISFDNFR